MQLANVGIKKFKALLQLTALYVLYCVVCVCVCELWPYICRSKKLLLLGYYLAVKLFQTL